MEDSAVASLFAEVGLDLTGLSDGVKQGTNAVNGFVQNILKAFKKTSGVKITPDSEKTKKELSVIGQQFEQTAKGILRSFVAPLTAAFSANRMFSNFISQADEWGKFAQKTRVNGETLQLWARAAVNAGGSAEALKNSVAGLQAKINQSVDLGRRGFTWQGGIQIRTVNADGSKREAFDVLRAVADKAKTMNETRFEGFASSLGIDKDTIQLLKLGGDELDKMIKRQKQLGAYTKEDFEISRKYNVAMNDMKQALSMVAAIISRVLVKPLTWLVDTFTDVVVYLREHQHFVEAFFVGLATAVTVSTIPAITKLALAMSPLIKTFAALAVLAVIVEDFFVWMEGGESAFGEWWEKLGAPEEIKKSWGDLKETFKEWGPALKTAAGWILAIIAGLKLLSVSVGVFKFLGSFAWTASGAIGAVSSAVKALGAGLISGVAAAAKWGAGIVAATGPVGWAILAVIAALAAMWYWWDDIKEAAGKCWDWICEKWGGFADWWGGMCASVNEKWGPIWDAAKEKCGSAWNAIKERWSGLTDWWNNLCDGISNKWSSMWDDIIGWFKKKIGALEDYIPDWLRGWFGSDDEEQTPEQKEDKEIVAARQKYENELVFSGMSPEEAGKQGEIYAKKLRRERAQKPVEEPVKGRKVNDLIEVHFDEKGELYYDKTKFNKQAGWTTEELVDQAQQRREMFNQVASAQGLAPIYAAGGWARQQPQQPSKTDIEQNININVDTKDDPQAVAEGVAGVFRSGGTAERASRNFASGTLFK